MIDTAILYTAQLTLFAIFSGAALHKLVDPRRFAGVFRDYRVVPSALAFPLAMAAIALETAVAASLLLPATRRLGALGVGVLLLSYSLAIVVNLLRGRRDIDCGCSWNAKGQPISGALVVRNALLMIPAALLFSAPALRPVALADLVVVIPATCGFFLCYRTVETLLANAPSLRRLAGTSR